MIQSFAPVADPSAKVLILGSMPGQASLDANQYYAYQRNAFWRILGALLDFDPCDTYEQRLTALKTNRVALWDVIASCKRRGSLDAAIEPDTVELNDFSLFLKRHRKIDTVFFNGRKAEHLFRQRVLPMLENPQHLQLEALPSTSPAHAALRFEDKLDAWRCVIEAASIRA